MTGQGQESRKVLVVDDSPLVRRFLQNCLERAEGLELAGLAPDPVFARRMLEQDRPDLVVLDVEMPRMDGLTFLREVLRPLAIPALVVSSHTPRGSALAMACLEAGAVDVLPKPDGRYTAARFARDLIALIRALTGPADALESPAAPGAPRDANASDRVVAIGASTGGPEALRRVLSSLPADGPAVVVAQHMPPLFTASLAASLDAACAMQVAEARHGEPLLGGQVRIAPGDRHLELVGRAGALHLRLHDGPAVQGHRPSVDLLFRSVAVSAGARGVGVLLTGMGVDGAEGLGRIRDAGGRTLVQDEPSCVVFGMPRAAILRGAAQEVLPPEGIGRRLRAWSSSLSPSGLR